MAENGHLPGVGGSGAICIPIQHSDEVVRVPLDELPEDPEELLEVLQAEEASLTLWLDFAKAYLARGRLEQCRTILEAGTSQEVRGRGFHARCDAVITCLLIVPAPG